jgi:uncharacterized protein (DUF983 family)
VEKKSKKDDPLKFYARYSSLAFQMIIIIVGGAFGGKALDNKLEWGFPVWTVVLTILAVFIALYLGMRDLFNKNHE